MGNREQWGDGTGESAGITGINASAGAVAQLGRVALCAVVLGRGSRGVIAVEA